MLTSYCYRIDADRPYRKVAVAVELQWTDEDGRTERHEFDDGKTPLLVVAGAHQGGEVYDWVEVYDRKANGGHGARIFRQSNCRIVNIWVGNTFGSGENAIVYQDYDATGGSDGDVAPPADAS